MSRRKKFFLNSFSGLIKQVITLVCGFIMTRTILKYYGSLVNGLVSSISQFLGVISFLEMGIGPVIQSNLYLTLAENDNHRISEIVKSSKRFFKILSYIFIIYIIILCAGLPKIIRSEFSQGFIVSLILIMSISSLTQYYYGMTYQLLLNADQIGYVQITIQWALLLCSTILSIILIKFGATIHVVKLITTFVYILRPILINIYVKNNYCIDKNVIYKTEPIKQKWNGFAQHLSAVIAEYTDIVVLTFMSTMKNVSIYVVYYNISYGMTQIIMTAVNSLESMWGNMVARDEWDVLKESFSYIEWFLHTIITIVFTATVLLITSFVIVYTKGITDVNYNYPTFGMLLATAFAMQCYRVPYFRLIKAVGHYKETQIGAYIAAILNVSISVVSVKKMGLLGVAVGTLVAFGYYTFYLVIYLSKNIINRSVKYFIKHMVVNFLIALFSYVFINPFIPLTYGYYEWVITAIKVTSLIIIISLILNLIFYLEETKKTFIFAKERIKRFHN